MTLLFEEDGAVSLALSCEELAYEIIEKTLDFMKCPYEAEVNLTLTTDEEIHRINKEFRGIDRPTDVLSFPMVEYELPGDFSKLEDQADCFNPDTGELMLGDIVISKERVQKQAEEYGHSIRREYAFLIVHSMLHLMGYDHMEEDERVEMEFQQKQIMDFLQITRN